MELKISHVENKSREAEQSKQRDQSEDCRADKEDMVETAAFDNGISVYKKGSQYFLSVEEQMLPVSKEELMIVTANPDYAFDLIMEKRGKFWFNASIDNVGLNRETI